MIWSRPPYASAVASCALKVDAEIGGSVETYCPGRWVRTAEDERTEAPAVKCGGCWLAVRASEDARVRRAVVRGEEERERFERSLPDREAS